MSEADPTMDIELEGYDKKGAPGMLRNKGGAAMKHKAKRARGGAMEHEEEEMHKKAKKAGGKVSGKMAMKRPDKRARGGATDTSDEHPITSAGKMEMKPFEKESQEGDGEGGKGPDKEVHGD